MCFDDFSWTRMTNQLNSEWSAAEAPSAVHPEGQKNLCLRSQDNMGVRKKERIRQRQHKALWHLTCGLNKIDSMRGAEMAVAQESFLPFQVFENRLQHIAWETQHLHMEPKVIWQ